MLRGEIYPEKEIPLEVPEWKPAGTGHKSPVVETGPGGIEVCTFTQHAGQHFHYHKVGTEIFTVLEGTMKIRLVDPGGEETIAQLNAGDEVIIFPGTPHEILTEGTFLSRVHSINCLGKEDKFILES